MRNAHFVKISGILFTLSALLYVGASIMLGNRAIYAWLGLWATVLLALSLWGVYDFLKIEGNQTSLKLGISAMLTGLIFLFGIYTAAFLTDTFDQVESFAQPVLDTTDAVFETLNLVVILIGALLTYGVSPALLAHSGLRASMVPRWLSWMGLVGGLYSLLWAGWGWFISPDNMFILLPGVFLVYLWQVLFGVVMIRFKEKEASHE